MKWTYSIKQKTTTAILFATILGMVMWNNYYQSRQFDKIVSSFSSLYEDRLIVESYIYNISELLHQKIHILENTINVVEPKKHFKNIAFETDRTIEELIDQYKKTKFTENESKHFKLLLSGISELLKIENAYILSEQNSRDDLILKDALKSTIEINLKYLSKLSDIQVEEGKKMHMESKQILMSNISASQLETTFLIIIGIVIQMLIFASNSMRSILKQKPELN